jgi:transposase
VRAPDRQKAAGAAGKQRKEADMSKRSIFPERSQVTEELFASSEPGRVLVVPIDFAKTEHTAQICRGTGEFVFRKPMRLENTVDGAHYLLQRLEACRERFSVAPGNVVIAGEDAPSYALNFLTELVAGGAAIARVNSREATKYRTNTRATSDCLALNGIAQAVLCHRAYDVAEQDELYAVMKAAERARRRLVWQQTAAGNRIHRCVEVLFPGFLSEKATGLQPFGTACLDLMSDDFSVGKIRRMKLETLTGKLHRHQVQRPNDAAARIKALANSALTPPPQIVPYQTRSLAAKVELLRAVRTALAQEENEMARCLVQSPGFFLTSIPGLGVVLTGGIVAESGNPDRWSPADRLASYAGIVGRQFQTGGSAKAPVAGTLPRNANRILKDWVLQAAFHVGTTEHPAWTMLGLPGQHPLYEHYHRIEARNGRSLLGTGKKLLAIGRAMARDRRIYLPLNAIDPQAPQAMPAAQYLEYSRITMAMMLAKWKGCDLRGIPDERNLLVRFQEDIEAITHNHTRSNS